MDNVYFCKKKSMKNLIRFSFLVFIYYSVVILSSCCADSNSVLNGMINTAILSDYDAMAEAVNNDVIRTGFRITLFPDTDIVGLDFNPMNEVYGQDCITSVDNSIINSTATISFSKDITIGSNTYSAGTNLLTANQFQAVEISSDCLERNFCEIVIGFPTSLVSTMDVADGPLTINFTALTDDDVSFNYDFETMIDLL